MPIPLNRVVAITVALPDGREQVGSGYLLTGHRVVTARHCARDAKCDERVGAGRIRVLRATDGTPCTVSSVIEADTLDVAVLDLTAPGFNDVPALPLVARVDRDHGGVLANCEAIGYPLFQWLEQGPNRHHGELHSLIYQTDEAEAGRLLLKAPELRGVSAPDLSGEPPDSPFGGLSGALVFFRDAALGVVVEHHPQQGDAVQLIALDTVARAAAHDPGAREVADALGLSDPEALPLAGAEPIRALADLVEVCDGQHLPLVGRLNPYALGAAASPFGNGETYGCRDPYVARTQGDVDARLRAALDPGALVLLVGPSKSGKTRTMFEAVRARWPEALVAVPMPGRLADLALHPDVMGNAEPLIVWLDDVERCLAPGDLTCPLLDRLARRAGRTVFAATLRPEQRHRLSDEQGEPQRDVKLLLQRAAPSTLTLRFTSEDPAEKQAAQTAYPQVDLSTYGLAEQLAGAPALLQSYTDAPPLLRAVVETAVDWTRIGMLRPIPTDDLRELAGRRLLQERPDLEPTNPEIDEAIRDARERKPSLGRSALLTTTLLDDGRRGYRAFDYLRAADDWFGSQSSESAPPPTSPARPIPAPFWDQVLERATTEELAAIGRMGWWYDAERAVAALTRAAEADNADAQVELGFRLVQRRTAFSVENDCYYELPPRDLEAGRRWLEMAAAAGNVHGIAAYATFLLEQADPPEAEEAQRCLERGVEAGDAWSASRLGTLLLERGDPSDLTRARALLTRAAEGGMTWSMTRLAKLLLDEVKPAEVEAACGWLERAKAAGDRVAGPMLAKAVLERTDATDVERARTLLTEAAEGGDRWAMSELGQLLVERVDPPEQEEARRSLERAVELGDIWSAGYLGGLLLADGDAADVERARSVLIRAAEAGDVRAMWRLGTFLAEELDPPDPTAAREWLKRAAESGEPYAMAAFASFLLYRLDPPATKEGWCWVDRAAVAGEPWAMSERAARLLHGGNPSERAEALSLLGRAAEAGEPWAKEMVATNGASKT